MHKHLHHMSMRTTVCIAYKMHLVKYENLTFIQYENDEESERNEEKYFYDSDKRDHTNE